MSYPEPRRYDTLGGYEVMVDDHLGHIAVSHHGDISWEELQEIKTANWGRNACAIEVYPADADIVNNANIRHLWLLGENDFCPDLLGRANSTSYPPKTLEARYHAAWEEAKNQGNSDAR